MKRNLLLLFVFCSLIMQKTAFSQIYFAEDAQKKISEASAIAYESGRDLPVFIKLQKGKEIEFANWQSWISKRLKLSAGTGFTLLNAQKDQIGDIHYHYIQTTNGAPILGNSVIVHTRNNMIYSINGKMVASTNVGSGPGISEQAALTYALSNFNATEYKWQNTAEEAMLKKITGNPDATYYPKGELYIIPDKGDFKSTIFRLTYRFDIYSTKPLKREYVFVDATTGEVIYTLNRIEATDVPGTAVTKYSGTQTIITDSTAATSYRLHEADRGNGIETYNLQTSTNYGSAVDFTDSDNIWNNVNAAHDEVATDAHWGAEMTYDYYKNKFNRNSIDDNGYKLISFVHYDVNYVNAYWDGQEMTYGDGDATYSPLTALDVCGHEITHGVDERTANLIYTNESGALNEGYSDIFGTCIEWYARPANADWLMGADLGSAFRNMSDPNMYNQPDTYQGLYWDPAQEVHRNSGVVAYWFYLTAHGGAGTNDNSSVYNVTGITMDKAAAVAYRTLTVYLPSSATYADARFYSILSAMDLYGACTPEVQSVTDAWYAVGVGNAYSPVVTAGFTPDLTTFCTPPATVHFTNQSNNSNQFHWNFGDGTTSTDMNPDHTYTSYGTYSVKLVAYGGSCGNDSILQASVISVDSLNPCVVFMPAHGIGNIQTECSGTLFDSGGPANYQDSTHSTLTIAPAGAQSVTLSFTTFAFEPNYDFLTIYDGWDTLAPVIGSFTGYTLPNGGTITSTSGALTLVQTSDEGVNDTGFVATWICTPTTTHPTTNFKANDTVTCSGFVKFTDISSNGPTSWLWNFGDGNTSAIQHPTHQYATNGTYSVKLVTGNSFGLDSLSKTSYITYTTPMAPVGYPASRCDSGSVTLTATGSTIYWYDAAAGGNLVNTGGTFVTPTLGATTTYYVESAIGSPAQHVGPLDNTIGTGNISTFPSSRFLKFDVISPVTLKSVLVYSDTAMTRDIYVADAAGTILHDTIMFVTAGTQRITLNFDLPTGTNLRFGVNGLSRFFRNQNGAVWPYTLPGLVSITGNSSTQPGNTAYYYFYDWEIGKAGCASERIPVTATILLPNAQVTPNGNITICNGQDLTLTAQLADSYYWLPGGQTTQSIVINSAGSYAVQITKDSCAASSLPIIVTTISNEPQAAFGYVNSDPSVTFSDSSLYASSYSWNFGDGSTSTIQNPSHTYAANGTYIVTLVVTNACGTDTITHVLDISMAGISEIGNNNSVAVYPNPSNGNFYIDVQTNDNMTVNYRIYDLIGKEVKSGSLSTLANKAKMQISMSDARGVYLLHVWNATFNLTRKIVIN